MLSSFPKVTDLPYAIENQEIEIEGEYFTLPDYDYLLIAPEFGKTINRTYMNEPKILTRMYDIIKEGEDVMADIYAYRSCSQSLPLSTSQQQEFSRVASHILKKEIDRQFLLKDYYSRSTSFLNDLIAIICSNGTCIELPYSHSFLYQLAQMIGLFISIDIVKKNKTLMNNDLALYKRVLATTSSDVSNLQMLSMFIAQQDNYFNFIKSCFESKDHIVYDMIQDMIIYITKIFEKELLVPPDEKIRLDLALAIGIYILDVVDTMEITKRKRIKLDLIHSIIQKNEIVPIFGDIGYSKKILYSKCICIKWDDSSNNHAINLHDLLIKFRKRYLQLIAIIDSKSNEKDKFQQALSALQLLNKVCSCIRSIHFWKIANPSNKHQNASLFDCSVRYNYSQQELDDLLELIFMIDRLTRVYHSYGLQMEVIIRNVYELELRSFIANKIEDLRVSLAKKNKFSLGPIAYIQRIAHKANFKLDNTIIYIIQSVLVDVINEKSKGMKTGFMHDRDFKDHNIQDIQNFIDFLFTYRVMNRFNEYIINFSDLSCLWFREFQLALNESVEIPLSSSLPNILADRAYKSKKSGSLCFIFIPFSIYNAAGEFTLKKIKRQFLYDELESEVMVVFNKCMLYAAQRIYTQFKSIAARKLLKSTLKSEKYSIERSSMIDILKRRQISILGHNIDPMPLLSAIITNFLRKSIDVAISRFENSGITYFKEFESLIDVCKETHSSIAKYILLEDFDLIMDQVNESISENDRNGRILTHLIHELLNDLVPNYCFNSTTQRFIKASVLFTEPARKQSFPKAKLMHLYGSKDCSIAFSMEYSAFRDIFSKEHITSIIEFIGIKELPVLIRHISQHIEHVVKSFITEIVDMAPKNLRFPLYEYGPIGSFDYFIAHLIQISSMENLCSEIFQSFREIGNCFIIVQMIDDIMMSLLLHSNSSDGKMHSIKLFDLFSSQIKTTLMDTTELASNDHPLMNFNAFFKIWSYIQFLYCVPNEDQISYRELFGDGFHYAGCLINSLLNQTHYSSHNLNMHLLSVQKEFPMDRENSRQDIVAFLEIVKQAEDLSKSIYEFLS